MIQIFFLLYYTQCTHTYKLWVWCINEWIKKKNEYFINIMIYAFVLGTIFFIGNPQSSYYSKALMSTFSSHIDVKHILRLAEMPVAKCSTELTEHNNCTKNYTYKKRKE